MVQWAYLLERPTPTELPERRTLKQELRVRDIDPIGGDPAYMLVQTTHLPDASWKDDDRRNGEYLKSFLLNEKQKYYEAHFATSSGSR